MQSIFGVLKRSEHAVTVHLQLSSVGLGQLSERVSVPGSRPCHEIGCYHALITFLLASRLHVIL